jgi:hypothetical protein
VVNALSANGKDQLSCLRRIAPPFRACGGLGAESRRALGLRQRTLITEAFTMFLMCEAYKFGPWRCIFIA